MRDLLNVSWLDIARTRRPTDYTIGQPTRLSYHTMSLSLNQKIYLLEHSNLAGFYRFLQTHPTTSLNLLLTLVLNLSILPPQLLAHHLLHHLLRHLPLLHLPHHLLLHIGLLSLQSWNYLSLRHRPLLFSLNLSHNVQRGDDYLWNEQLNARGYNTYQLFNVL